MPVKESKSLKWNKNLVIQDLFGIPGAIATLGCSDYTYRGRYVDNYSYFTIELKNNVISFYRYVNFNKSGRVPYNKAKGKVHALEVINANKEFYIDCMKSQSMEELDMIIKQTKLYRSLEKNYNEMKILQKKKEEYEDDYKKKREQYECDLKEIHIPLKWVDKVVGQRIVGTELKLVSKCIGYDESTYKRLPDTYPRSSFESPDYAIVSHGSPIYAESYERVNIYEDIIEKKPVIRNPIKPQMHLGFTDTVARIAQLQKDIDLGLSRKRFIQDNPDRYI